MLELGPEEAAMHAALARDPAMGSVAVVHCVGPRMRALHEALPDGKRGLWAERPEELEGELERLLAPGDVVLVKGSKGSRVARLVDAIRRIGQQARSAITDERA
jgi:UDP-N-acetylmuramoyl-tripeptide--D-alanyl-D-alanine ligase